MYRFFHISKGWVIFSDPRCTGFYGHTNSVFQHISRLENVFGSPVLPNLWRFSLVSRKPGFGRKYRLLLFPRLSIYRHIRMQARLVLLGQKYLRQMHQRDSILPVERRRQSAHRLHDPESHIPNGQVLAKTLPAKTCIEWYLPTGYMVSIPGPFQMHFHLWSYSTLMYTCLPHSVIAASIARVVSFEKLNSDDNPYMGVTPAIWTDTEQALGIVCACLPCLQPLFSKRCPLYTSDSGSRSGSAQQSRDIRLSRVGLRKIPKGRVTRKPAGYDSTAVFTRLGKESATPATMTTVTRGSRSGRDFSQDGIIMRQSVELRYDES